jgi:hypothetical protein
MKADLTATRYHSLDALRAFALLLGIVFHAAESFCPGRLSWAVVDHRAHGAFDFFQHVCHSFRMEIFFLIAGFFAHMLLCRIGERGFIIHRSRRILLPFLAGWCLLYPLVMLVWTWGKSTSGSLADFRVPPELWSLGPLRLTAGFILSGAILRGGFGLAHLWFLYYLLLLYALALVARRVVLALDGSGALRGFADRVFAAIFRSRWSLIAFAGMTLPLTRLMGGGVATPNRSLVPNVPVLLVYGLFFGVGWLLHRHPQLLHVIERRRQPLLATGFGMVLMELAIGSGGIVHDLLVPLGFGLREIHRGMYVLMMWAFVLGITGFFLAAMNRESRWWRYAADSSYWLYLVHLFAVVPLQVLVAPLGWNPSVKFLLINIVAFAVLYASYHYLVRDTFLGVFLNGRRYPRRRAAASRAEKLPSPAAALEMTT